MRKRRVKRLSKTDRALVEKLMEAEEVLHKAIVEIDLQILQKEAEKEEQEILKGQKQ